MFFVVFITHPHFTSAIFFPIVSLIGPFFVTWMAYPEGSHLGLMIMHMFITPDH